MFKIDDAVPGFDFATYVVNETTSTMDLARRCLDSMKSSNYILALVARRQTQGRGRGGSQWMQAAAPSSAFEALSEPSWRPFSQAFEGEWDVLPTTFVIPPQRIRIPLEWVTLAAGCAVADALRGSLRFLEQIALGGVVSGGLAADAIRIKWPNDILVWSSTRSSRKLCGILCETSFVGSGLGNVFMGIGLNFFQAPSLETATSLWEAFLEHCSSSEARKYRRFFSNAARRNALLRDFSLRMQQELTDYLCTPRTVGQLRALALERSIPFGTTLSVNKGQVRGGFLGIDSVGRLLLSGVDAPVVAGEVLLADPLPPPTVEDPLLAVAVSPSKGSLHSTALASNKSPVGDSLERPLFRVSHRSSPSTPSPAISLQEISLACDFGNTRMHWGALVSDRFLNGHLSYDLFSAKHDVELRKLLRPFLATLRGAGLLRICFASVAGREETRKRIAFLKEFVLRSIPSVKIETAELFSSFVMQSAGLESQYAVETLGVDRALRFFFAGRRARERGSSVLVCGAGTAVTLEAVSPQGQILDSGILPGFRMMFDSLHRGTARLPALNWPPTCDESEAAACTEEVPADGAALRDLFWTTNATLLQGVTSAVSGALIQVAERSGVRLVLLAGGDAERLAGLLRPWASSSGVEVEVAVGLELQAMLSLFSKSIPTTEKETPADCALPLSEDTALRPPPAGDNATDAVVQSLWRSRKRQLASADVLRELDHFRRLGPRVETDCLDVRIDRHLADRYRFHTRDEWRQRIIDGDVRVQMRSSCAPSENAAATCAIKHTYRTKLHDQIWLYHPVEHEPDCVVDVDVLGDDGDVVVFSKPGNLVIHAVGQYSRNTFLAVAERMGYGNASPVHRIDRETSGILLCARTSVSRRAISDAFRNGEMKKMYIAVCKPQRKLPSQFRVVAPIGDCPGSRIRLKLWVGGPGALDAETHFLVLSELDGYALVACYPQTGRTNQIRIHLAAAGAWIVGDKMYHSSEEVFLEFYDNGLTERVMSEVEFPRHMLHNAAIRAPPGLPSIVSNSPAICPLPADMMSFPPLRRLLTQAGISLERDAQGSAFCQLFEQAHEIHFSDMEPLPVL